MEYRKNDMVTLDIVAVQMVKALAKLMASLFL